MFEIEHDVPVAPSKFGGKRKKYPIAELKPGDSFFIPTQKKHNVQASVSACLSRYKRRSPGTDFVTRSVDGGVRVWRIK